MPEHPFVLIDDPPGKGYVRDQGTLTTDRTADGLCVGAVTRVRIARRLSFKG